MQQVTIFLKNGDIITQENVQDYFLTKENTFFLNFGLISNVIKVRNYFAEVLYYKVKCYLTTSDSDKDIALIELNLVDNLQVRHENVSVEYSEDYIIIRDSDNNYYYYFRNKVIYCDIEYKKS